jgi:flagellar protein FlaI
LKNKADVDGEKHSSSTAKSKDILEIDNTVDDLLHRNTSERFDAKKFSPEKFSPEGKGGNSMYYADKKNKKETKEMKRESRKQKQKEAKLEAKKKQKQKKMELAKEKADAKQAEKEKEKQKKATLEAKEKERKAEQAEKEKEKQKKMELAKEKAEAKQAEKEKEKQKKATLEAKEKERKAEQAEKEKEKQKKMELAKEKAEAKQAEKEKRKQERETKTKPSKISKGETKQPKDSKHILFGKTEKQVELKEKEKEVKVKTPKTSKDKKHLLFGKTEKEHAVKPPMPHVQKTKQDIIGDEPATENAEKLKRNTLEKLGFLKDESWEELEFRPLIEPFAYALVIRKTETLDNLYIVVEIELTNEESEKLKLINEILSKFTVDTNELELKGRDKYLKERIDQIMEDYTIELDATSKKRITYFLEKELLGLGKLEPLMKDPNIEDISCDSSDAPLFIYHRNYGSLVSSVKFVDEDELSDLVVKLSQKCGKHISIANPMLDATMPDGSRIQMTLSSEVTTKGSTFTIRKFKENPFSPSDLVEFNTMSAEMLAYMWMAVEYGANGLIAGGTASGKTSTLNALALFIPPEAKIVTIEETREINLPHSNWIPGVARSGFGDVVGGKVTGEIDMYDLMKAALRQRPEYILVGEIRGRESYVLFQAMATGHTTYSTVHADSTKSLIHRLEGEPINIPRVMLQSLDIVCIQTISRVKGKRARRCKQVIEIVDIDPSTKEILTNEVFRWDPVEDKFIYSDKSYVLDRIRTEKNQNRKEITDELKRRAELLGWMAKKNIKEFRKVASLIVNYIDNPSGIMIKINEDKGR